MEGQRFGNYRVVRQLGEGGMGMVFEAVREDIGGRVAIKVLREELAGNKSLATRFFNEARAANLIEHPGIVKATDFGHLPNGSAYIAMEYLDGESLASRIKRGALPVAEVVRIGRQIASALAAAHAKQVVHRDLKPANVMLVPEPEAPGGERVKVLDFGIAKLASGGGPEGMRTSTGMLMGTPSYMSPEQCRGAGLVDDKTDVYALGVMLYQMLSGRLPFVAEGDGEIIAMHLFTPVPPLASLTSGLPSEMLALVDALLEKGAAARPTASAVAQELQKIGTALGMTGLSTGPPKPLPAAPPPLLPAVLPPSVSASPIAVAGPVSAVSSLIGAEKKSPPPARRPPVALLGGLAALGLAIGAVVLITRDPQTKEEPSAPPAPPEQHDEEGANGRRARSDPQPTTAKAEPDPTDPNLKLAAVLDEQADLLLSQAQTHYVNGDYKQAIKTAQLVQANSPVRAWRIIGSSACMLADINLVNSAYEKLDRPGRTFLNYVCKRQHIVRVDDRFQLKQ